MSYTFEQDYPPAQLGYETLVKPSTFTSYCFQPNCPITPFPVDKFEAEYTQEQQAQRKLGLERYLTSRQIQRDHFPAANPVFNSNMNPLVENYMDYTRKENDGFARDYMYERFAR